MGDVTLTVDNADRSSGANYSDNKTAATDANDYYAINDGNLLLIAESAGGATVTVEVVETVDGLAVTDLALTAPAGEIVVFGPFPPAIYNDSDGKIHVTVDANTSLLALGR